MVSESNGVCGGSVLQDSAAGSCFASCKISFGASRHTLSGINGGEKALGSTYFYRQFHKCSAKPSFTAMQAPILERTDSREDRKNRLVVGLFSKLEESKEAKRLAPATKYEKLICIIMMT
jgi:hypothetical protein